MFTKLVTYFGPTMKFLKEVKGLGFTAILFLGLAIGLFMFGFKVSSGIALGVFLKANWDIISCYINDKTGLEL